MEDGMNEMDHENITVLLIVGDVGQNDPDVISLAQEKEWC